jgi:hypothetical protein
MKNEQLNAPRPVADGKADDPAAGSLDKVRDILFGQQVRDADRRFARLEERIAQESAELKEDVRKRLGMLEQFVKREVESLAERLKLENEARTDADKELLRELHDNARTSDKKFSAVDDQAGRLQRELRQQLHDIEQRITDDIQRQAHDSQTRLARESDELRSDKLDRTALAAMLTEVAMRLTADPRTADGE